MIGKIFKWVLGSKTQAMQKLRSLTNLYVGTPLDVEGDPQGNMMGVPAGGVVWPVDPFQHDGASFLAADCFLALYNHTIKKVVMLDEGTRAPNPLGQVPVGAKPPVEHPGATPLSVGIQVDLASNLTGDAIGIVVRSAEYGTDGLRKNVFFALASPTRSALELIAQQIFDGLGLGGASGPDPSTEITEPGADGGPIKGKLNDLLFVGREPSTLRATFDDTGSNPPPETPIPQPSSKDRPTAVLAGSLSPFVHGGAFPKPPFYRSNIAIHFIGETAVMSWQKGGPLRPLQHSRLKFARTQPTHKSLGTPGPTGANIWSPGALDALASFSHGAAFEGPDDRAPILEPPVGGSSGFLTRVFHLFDTKDKFAPKGGAHVLDKVYPNLGPRRGVFRWSLPLPFTKTSGNPGSNPLPVSGSQRPKPKDDDDKKKRDDVYYWDGNIEIGGSDGLPFPNIHKLAR